MHLREGPQMTADEVSIESLRPHARRRRDKRSGSRIVVDAFDLAVDVSPDELPGVTLVGRLEDISAGGCRITAPRWSVEVLMRGSRCMIGVEDTKAGVQSFPATVVSIKPTGDILVARVQLRFRKTDAIRQHKLTDWLADLAVQSWYV